ncbi:MAG: DNA repair protein RecN, partial [Propionibacteriaceae bacterium]|nr:DNA repair protein RecN [Propionibacteriaceae bacterium]
MLTELTIRHVGVIEEATLTPGPGLTVVTGETGAGKTMVVVGLGLMAGARTDSSVVRNQQGQARVEARFTDVPASTTADVVAAGGVIEDGELLIARQVSATGRSRSWIGGAGVTQSVAAGIGADLVTIHGQSEQVHLSTPDRQRQVLDRAGGPDLESVLGEYHALFEQRKALASQLAALTESARERAREADMLAYGLDEIARVGPSPGEDEALVREAKRLQDADDLRVEAHRAIAALAGDDEDLEAVPVLTLMAMARKALGKVARTDADAEAMAAQADEVSALATDLAGQVSSYLANLAADPVRLEWIESRLAELKSLTRKYGPDATAVLAWAADSQTRLAELQQADERIAEWGHEVEEMDARLSHLAQQITALRTGAADEFAKRVAGELAALAMPHATVEFMISPSPDLGPWGEDVVTLLFTANPGSSPAPLGKVASGGELSRVRLAIEAVLADSRLKQVFVFDEVDAGVGGAVG